MKPDTSHIRTGTNSMVDSELTSEEIKLEIKRRAEKIINIVRNSDNGFLIFEK